MCERCILTTNQRPWPAALIDMGEECSPLHHDLRSSSHRIHYTLARRNTVEHLVDVVLWIVRLCCTCDLCNYCTIIQKLVYSHWQKQGYYIIQYFECQYGIMWRSWIVPVYDEFLWMRQSYPPPPPIPAPRMAPSLTTMAGSSIVVTRVQAAAAAAVAVNTQRYRPTMVGLCK